MGRVGRKKIEVGIMDRNLKYLLNCEEAELKGCNFIKGGLEFSEDVIIFYMSVKDLCFELEGGKIISCGDGILDISLICGKDFKDVEIRITDNEFLYKEGYLVRVYKEV